jgi:3,4-dihydroxy 2-butanone 4-phosphate synthase/GTP cyclohydrolase II
VTSPFSEHLSPIEEILDEAQNGRMFILVDDEDRENEGDLVIPAQMATPDAINFMATHGRGLICLSLTGDRCRELNLPMMDAHNQSRLATAFTVSIEAKEGVTTGISAGDRARTISVAVDPTKGKDDLATPGHVFPLMARDGGVLVRAGHTEAAVDIARLSGLNPAGVICEIMNDDGTMARMPDLIPFAQRHGLKIATIADLIAYRRRTEKLVRREVQSTIKAAIGGDWALSVYVNTLAYAEHVVLTKGDLSDPAPVMVRMHALHVLDDVLGDLANGRQGQLQASMDMIAKEGRGVVVLLREANKSTLSEQIRERLGEGDGTQRLVDYGVGAQILLDLGLKDMILLSNSEKNIIGLDGYGLRVVERRPIAQQEA